MDANPVHNDVSEDDEANKDNRDEGRGIDRSHEIYVRRPSSPHLTKIGRNEFVLSHMGNRGEGISAGMGRVIRYYSDGRRKVCRLELRGAI